MINEFKNYHPLVNFVYFAAITVFAVLLMHPVCLTVTLVAGLIYSAMLGSGRISNISMLIAVMLTAAVINPLFNHAGITVIVYMPGGNPLTMESIVYGIAAAFMLAGVISWFACFNKIMTSDKIIYLFGRVMPSLSLILSMTLKFVPGIKEQASQISRARRGTGNDASRGNIIKKAKNGITVLSALITWALENSIETADSMKARGYGLRGRTAFSVYIFCKRDLFALVIIFLLAGYITAGIFMGALKFEYFPQISFSGAGIYSISVLSAHAALCAVPFVIEITEALKWKASELKI